MLVLTRKQGEKIQIGENIVVKVIKTGKTTVKIGIEAPADVRVMRAELCEPTAARPSTKVVPTAPQEATLTKAQLSVCSDQFPHTVQAS